MTSWIVDGCTDPDPMSRSADLFIKQPTFTIEVQDKSGVSTGVSFADVRKEVGKCIQSGSVLWVLVALKLDESLSHCENAKQLFSLHA